MPIRRPVLPTRWTRKPAEQLDGNAEVFFIPYGGSAVAYRSRILKVTLNASSDHGLEIRANCPECDLRATAPMFSALKSGTYRSWVLRCNKAHRLKIGTDSVGVPALWQS